MVLVGLVNLNQSELILSTILVEHKKYLLTILIQFLTGQEMALQSQFSQAADITLQRQMSAPPEIGLSRQVTAAQDVPFTRQLSTPAPQDLTQQAQQQQYTANPQYQGPQF